MSCAPFDLKDYLFEELPAAEHARVGEHLAVCPDCCVELERLRATRRALLALRDEEPTRRVAFVSDRVFEPRWWQRLWQSGPQLGFVSAAMLSIAILTHGLVRPAPAIPEVSAPVNAGAETARVEALVEREVSRRLRSELAQATADLDARIQAAVTASEKRQDLERRADLVAIQEHFTTLRKQMNRFYIASTAWERP